MSYNHDDNNDYSGGGGGMAPETAPARGSGSSSLTKKKKPVRGALQEMFGCISTDPLSIITVLVVGFFLCVLLVMGVLGLFKSWQVEDSLRKTNVYCLTFSGLNAVDNNNVIRAPIDTTTRYTRGEIQLSTAFQRVCIDVQVTVFPESGKFGSMALYGATTSDSMNEVDLVPVIDFLAVDCPNNNVAPTRGDSGTHYRGCVRMETTPQTSVIEAVMLNPNHYYIDIIYTASVNDLLATYTLRSYLENQCKVGLDLEKSEYTDFPRC